MKYTINAAIAAMPWIGYHWLSWSFDITVLVYLFLILQAVLNHTAEGGDT